MIEEILKYNDTFVNSGFYKHFNTNKYPKKRLALITCMDTRLVELLPAALGVRSGDVKLIKTAGSMIINPYDSTIRSLLIAVLEYGVDEVMVIGHTDCLSATISSETIITHLVQRGIERDTIQKLKEDGFDLDSWLQGMDNVKTAVKQSVTLLKTHPLMPSNVIIRGFIMDISCGRLSSVS